MNVVFITMALLARLILWKVACMRCCAMQLSGLLGTCCRYKLYQHSCSCVTPAHSEAALVPTNFPAHGLSEEAAEVVCGA